MPHRSAAFCFPPGRFGARHRIHGALRGGPDAVRIILLIFLAAVVGLAPAGCRSSEEKRRAGLLAEQKKKQTDQQPYYPGLIEEYLNVLAGDPNNRAAIIALANAFFESGQWREAIEYYQEALRIDPHDADIRTDLGTCYRNLGMPDRAIAEYRKARLYNPGHLNARYQLGIVYAFHKNDPARAIREWEDLLTIAPGFPHAPEIRTAIRKLRAKADGGAAQ